MGALYNAALGPLHVKVPRKVPYQEHKGDLGGSKAKGTRTGTLAKNGENVAVGHRFARNFTGTGLRRKDDGPNVSIIIEGYICNSTSGLDAIPNGTAR